MLDELKQKIDDIQKTLDQLKGFLDLDKKKQEISEIEAQMQQGDFWDDQAKANKIMSELKHLKSCVEPYEKSLKQIQDAAELLELSENDSDLLASISEELDGISKQVSKVETSALLSGPYDKNNVILSINAGAGGTESCDWASMLFRMYQRWAEQAGHNVEVVDVLHGDEAGIKSATLNIQGSMVYGNIKSEKGVHRLVRISPFDSNKRRHTSFASVDVIPEADDDIEIEINNEDLRIDVYRSSGPGGQSVNTTDSAVRVTHIPTGIVAQCQNGRSQITNKETAMRILKARLYEHERQKQEAEMAKEYGEKQKIEWGSQIRSYVMHPYSMVKDHRTNVETGNVAKVMDGGLDEFIEAYLRLK